MSRIPKFTKGFHAGAKRLRITHGSKTARALARAINELTGADPLPLPGDVETIIPPTKVVHAHPVAGTSWWLWYREWPGHVILEFIDDKPPPVRL
jgi:hypothetical protein